MKRDGDSVTVKNNIVIFLSGFWFELDSSRNDVSFISFTFLRIVIDGIV